VCACSQRSASGEQGTRDGLGPLSAALGFAMQKLYRYVTPENADTFVHEGEILFRSLSYYRDHYEDEGVRRDEYEGTRVHLPKDGLKLRYVATGNEVAVPYTFESTAKEDDIFISCFSTELSESIAQRFKAKSCVEIKDSAEFISLMRAALARCPSIKNKTLVCGPVKYYAPHDPPIVDWALPERITLSKPKSFQWQHEYRVAFAIEDAFAVENVKVKLVPLGQRLKSKTGYYQKWKIKIGSIAKLCQIHSF